MIRNVLVLAAILATPIRSGAAVIGLSVSAYVDTYGDIVNLATNQRDFIQTYLDSFTPEGDLSATHGLAIQDALASITAGCEYSITGLSDALALTASQFVLAAFSLNDAQAYLSAGHAYSYLKVNFTLTEESPYSITAATADNAGAASATLRAIGNSNNIWGISGNNSTSSQSGILGAGAFEMLIESRLGGGHGPSVVGPISHSNSSSISVSFSVPEPSVGALLGGTLAFGLLSYRRRTEAPTPS